MSISLKNTGEAAVLIVNEDSLAGDEAMELKNRAVELLDSGIMNISLDLSQPEYIDSSGIGKLLFMHKKVNKVSGSFSIIKINQTLYDFLDSLAITKVMDISQPL